MEAGQASTAPPRPGGHKGAGPRLQAWPARGRDPEPGQAGTEHVQLASASRPPGPGRDTGHSAGRDTRSAAHTDGLGGEGKLQAASREGYKGPNLGRWVRERCLEK